MFLTWFPFAFLVQSALIFTFNSAMEHKLFWCKVNKFYLNKRIAHLQTTKQDADDIFLVATCVVTDRAKSKWVKEILDHLHQDKRVYIAGCGSMNRGEAMDRSVFFGLYPELFPYEEKIVLLAEDPDQDPRNFSSGLKTPGQKLRTKNYIIIQNWCDNYCSFCLTIFKRGGHRNRPLEEIIAEINQVEAEGGKEVVITGINLAAWWASDTRKSEESRFSYLLEEILKQTTIPRIRISSIDPQYLTDHFFQIVSNPRFVPHFHFSIQSFSDPILKAMNRWYLSDKLDEVLTKIRRLDRPDQDQISIWADIISGFPWETEQDFQITCDAVQKYWITKLHAFPFSDPHQAEKIPASLLPDPIPQAIRKERHSRLIEIGEEVRDRFVESHYGKTMQVLIEEVKNGKSKGRTQNYIQVQLPWEYEKWSIVDVVLDEKNCIY